MKGLATTRIGNQQLLTRVHEYSSSKECAAHVCSTKQVGVDSDALCVGIVLTTRLHQLPSHPEQTCWLLRSLTSALQVLLKEQLELEEISDGSNGLGGGKRRISIKCLKDTLSFDKVGRSLLTFGGCMLFHMTVCSEPQCISQALS